MAVSTVMEGLQNVAYGITTNDKPSKLNRYSGGQQRKNQPYTGGYWHLIMSPPSTLMGSQQGSVENWFHSTAETFTPHTRSLSKVDIPGMGGLGSSFVSGQEITRTFSVAFREYLHLPILQQIRMWTSVIDSNLGISPLSGNEWVPSNYKGCAWVYLVTPTGGKVYESDALTANDLQQVFYYEGVFPEADPLDSLNSDIASPNDVQHSVSFSFDGSPLSLEIPGVLEKALTVINSGIGDYSFYDRLDLDNATVTHNTSPDVTPVS